MKFKLCGALILSFSILLLMFSQVLADGIIIPEPPICDGDFCPEPIIPLSNSPLAIKNHIVTVKIENQLAVTHVDQVFLNTANSPLEGTYLFPLPLDAVVQQFILWVDDEPVKGKILTAEEARETYENIVRSTRDPALLEYIGRGAFQASIFPIPAGGERRIELEYSQVLTADNGLVHYSYPLNTEKFSALPLEKVSISVDLETNQPIRAVYSPDHKVEVLRTNSTKAVASYEESNIAPDTDFNLFYSFGNEEAFHLFSFRDPRDPSDPDGFFLMLTSPRPDEISRNIDKDVLLVIDRSGSMEGEKMQQAKSAARYVLNHLAANDRFHITTFSSRVEHFSDGLSSVVDSAKAVQWIDNLQASSSTDINRALLETVAVADTERPTYLLFLTDGLPTIGERDASQILVNLEKRTLENIRLFSFGVGYDVDTLLLDTLSQQNHGLTTYVKPEESLDEMLSVFYEKISTPVLTNLELDVNGVMIYDVNPQPLPDLFQGSQLIISGRYREGGSARISLSGMTNDKPKTFQFDDQVFTEESSSTSEVETNLPRIWAARKIGNLLNQIRLIGSDRETIDQIVKISIRYGIVTPYTSFLVTEPLPLGAVEQERIANETYHDMQSMPAPSVSGAGAVQKAEEQNALSQSDAAPVLSTDASQTIKTVGARTFVLKDQIWIDTSYDADKIFPQKIKFLSIEYFTLSQKRPDLAACFALGKQVIVMDGSTAIQITD